MRYQNCPVLLHCSGKLRGSCLVRLVDRSWAARGDGIEIGGQRGNDSVELGLLELQLLVRRVCVDNLIAAPKGLKSDEGALSQLRAFHQERREDFTNFLGRADQSCEILRAEPLKIGSHKRTQMVGGPVEFELQVVHEGVESDDAVPEAKEILNGDVQF